MSSLNPREAHAPLLALDAIADGGFAEVEATLDGDAVLAAIPRAEGPALLRALIEQGVDIDEARWVGADLESVFMTETSSVEGDRP